MRISIRTRLFIAISIFVVIIISLTWLLNTGYLEDYYLIKKKDMLIDYGKEIDKLYREGLEDKMIGLRSIEDKIGGSVIIFNKERKIEYHTPNISGKGKNSGINNPWVPTISNEGLESVIKGGILFETSKHPRLETDFLTMGYKLSNDYLLLIQIPLASIREGVKVAKDFYLYIGGFSLIIGIILSFIFSKYFTNPIIKLNNVTKAMADLDFTNKIDITSKDEIGQLSNNINYLSSKLDDTISKLNNANRKLKDDIERKKELEEMRKEFISSVSHELKTPIALIMGYAEGLKDSVINDTLSMDYYCDVIIDESKKMDNLVKDLLNLTKMERGQFSLIKQRFNISKLVNEVLNKYEPIFYERRIKVNKEIEKDCFILGDKSRIEQVLINYINNGISHLDDNCRLDINVKKKEHNIMVSVFNSGKNIPEDEIDNLWISFYKLDRARSRDLGGTGLGLSIVKGIIDLHDGSYGINNRENGVEFWFKLKSIN